MLYLGTSSQTAKGREKSFYPPGLKPGDYLAHYATQFRTVECDATFYAIPSPKTVQGCKNKINGGFVVSAKIPQAITHEKVLEDCQDELNAFLRQEQGQASQKAPGLEYGVVMDKN